MAEFLSSAYIWLKALHVISVMAWMAGMLYLPRLFVYHCNARAGSELSETLKIMERRLLRAIINPSMFASWFFGLAMLSAGGQELWLQPWMVLKLFCAFAMTTVHLKLAGWRKEFEADKNRHTQKFFRIINEVPTVLLIIIVAMAIVQPG